MALDALECAFYAVEGAAEDADAGAGPELKLAEGEDLGVGEGLSVDSHKVAHLLVGDAQAVCLLAAAVVVVELEVVAAGSGVGKEIRLAAADEEDVADEGFEAFDHPACLAADYCVQGLKKLNSGFFEGGAYAFVAAASDGAHHVPADCGV